MKHSQRPVESFLNTFISYTCIIYSLRSVSPVTGKKFLLSEMALGHSDNGQSKSELFQENLICIMDRGVPDPKEVT